jgi:hypothetical protein
MMQIRENRTHTHPNPGRRLIGELPVDLRQCFRSPALTQVEHDELFRSPHVAADE